MRYENKIKSLADRVSEFCTAKTNSSPTLTMRRPWNALLVQAKLNRKDLDSGLAGAGNRVQNMADTLGVK